MVVADTCNPLASSLYFSLRRMPECWEWLSSTIRHWSPCHSFASVSNIVTNLNRMKRCMSSVSPCLCPGLRAETGRCRGHPQSTFLWKSVWKHVPFTGLKKVETFKSGELSKWHVTVSLSRFSASNIVSKLNWMNKCIKINKPSLAPTPHASLRL